MKRYFFLLLIGSLVVLASCAKDEHYEDPEEIDGGVINHTDKDAPKEIQSKEIKEFLFNFYLYDRVDSEGNHSFEFEIKDNQLQERGTNRTTPITEETLQSLQEIIDKYQLVKRNGIYEVTNALPVEYQHSTFEVIYESGEELRFDEDNDPEAEWTIEIYDLFAKVFEENGDSSFLAWQEENN